jgi:transposase
MTAKKRAEERPQRYDEAFRREAIRLWKSSGKSAEATARELGISVFQLYDWNRGAGVSRAADSARFPEMKPASKEELQGEVERLQRELTRMTEQRDILKKAAGILSEPSPSGMPGFKR